MVPPVSESIRNPVPGVASGTMNGVNAVLEPPLQGRPTPG